MTFDDLMEIFCRTTAEFEHGCRMIQAGRMEEFRASRERHRELAALHSAGAALLNGATVH